MCFQGSQFHALLAGLVRCMFIRTHPCPFVGVAGVVIYGPLKSNIDTQQSHVWNRRYIFQGPSFLVSMVDFRGVIITLPNNSQSAYSSYQQEEMTRWWGDSQAIGSVRYTTIPRKKQNYSSVEHLMLIQKEDMSSFYSWWNFKKCVIFTPTYLWKWSKFD